MGKLYKLTDEHREQLTPWADKWIANGMSTKAMDEDDKQKMRVAIIGLYESANLKPPPEHRIIFVSSPFIARFVAGFAAAKWYLRKNKNATEVVTKAATETATSDVELKEWYSFPIEAMSILSNKLNLGDFGLKCARESWRLYQGGNFWSGAAAMYSFFRHIVKLDLDYSKWQYWEDAAIYGSARFTHEEFCIISDRPEILKVDSQNRPHCEDGPFCKWRDGSALYCYHGVRIPGWIIEYPERITIKEINSESNAEIKRVMINKYGASRYLDDIGAKEIDRDRDTKGERILYGSNKDGIEIRIIKLENSTPEKDGSKKWYSFRVPPHIKTCHEAVAWQFGVDPKVYKPMIES